MKRVRNTDIQFKLDTKLINVNNFYIKFYTVNAENFYIKKTQDDVYTVERDATIEDEEVIASGGTTVTDYYLALDWSELVNIGQGVMNYQAVNNVNLEDFVDNWYNKGVTRTTEYYIDSDIILSTADGKNVLEKVEDVNKDLQKEIVDRIDGDLTLAERIDKIVNMLDSGGSIDFHDYYTKSETSGATEIATALEGKQDTLIAGDNITISGNVISAVAEGTDLSNYYTKDETSGATEIESALEAKLDASAYTPTDLTDYYTKTEVDTALDTKLDSSAYTPTDLTDYYTKSETSGKSEIATALEGKLDTTAYTPTDLTNYYTKSETSGKSEIANALNDKADKSNTYTKSETSGATEIASALNAKLDTTAYTPTDLTNYYTKSQTSGASEISTALGTKLDSTAYTPTDLTNYYTKSETSGKTELSTAFSDKLDVTAYTPTDLTNYYTKSETSGASEISTALEAKLDATAYTPTDLTNYYTKSETSGASEIATALNGKQDTLSAGTNITISGNVISAEGGGKAIEAGRGIDITTGATADTVSISLPISAGTGVGCVIIGDKGFASSTINGRNNLSVGASNRIDNASSDCCFISGYGCDILNSSDGAVAMGWRCSARADSAVAIGSDCSAFNRASFALGYGAISRNEYEISVGKYNNSVFGSTASGNTLFSVGNGTADNARHNAFEIRQNGDIYITSGASDIKLQDYLGGGGSVEVSSAIISGDTNAVAGGAVYDKFDEVEQVAAASIIALNDKIDTSVNSLSGAIPTVTSAVTNGSSAVLTSGGAYEQLGGLKLSKLTQSQYDSLQTYDNNTLYVIIDD